MQFFYLKMSESRVRYDGRRDYWLPLDLNRVMMMTNRRFERKNNEKCLRLYFMVESGVILREMWRKFEKKRPVIFFLKNKGTSNI